MLSFLLAAVEPVLDVAAACNCGASVAGLKVHTTLV